MENPVIIVTTNEEYSAQQIAQLQNKMEDLIPDFRILIINGSVDIKVISDKKEAIRLFSITPEDIKELFN